MSDFLKKFSKDTYENIKKPNFIEEDEKSEVDEFENESNIENNQRIDIITEIESNDDVKENTEDRKQEKQATFKTVNTKDEVFVRDDKKIQDRKKKIIIASVCSFVLVCICIVAYFKMNEIKVPQFIGEKTLNDVQIWAAKNKIELEYTSMYSIKADEGYIVKQSKKDGSTIQKGSNFTVVVSKGADPEEHIEVPDFMKMSLTEIESWKKKVKAANVNIEKVFHDEIEKGKTISFEYKSEGISEKNYRRKDKINVVVSKGKEVYEKNIDVPNFKDKAKVEVESWAFENEINVEYSEEANSKIAEGNVISQDIAPKTKIAKKDIIKIVISRGKVSYVPNFYGLDETQGQIAALQAEVMINVVYYYSNSVPANQLISQSLPAGSEVKEQNIALTYSLGKPYIANFDGSDLYLMVQSINEMNAKGANLTYQIVEVSSKEKRGTIITSNYKADFVNVGSHIVINVSKGN